MFKVVDQGAEDFVQIHQRGGGITQSAPRFLSRPDRGPQVERQQQSGCSGLAQKMAQRDQHRPRVGAGDPRRDVEPAQRRQRLFLPAQPLMHRRVGHARLVRVETGEAQRDYRRAEIPRQSRVVPQIAAEPLIAVPRHDPRRDPERLGQRGGAQSGAGMRPGIIVTGEQPFQIALQQPVPGQNPRQGEENLLRQKQFGLVRAQTRVQQAVAAGQDGALALNFLLCRVVADDELRGGAAFLEEAGEILAVHHAQPVGGGQRLGADLSHAPAPR